MDDICRGLGDGSSELGEASTATGTKKDPNSLDQEDSNVWLLARWPNKKSVSYCPPTGQNVGTLANWTF